MQSKGDVASGGGVKWVLVLPALAYLLAFTVYPVVANLYVAISSGTLVSFLDLPFVDQTVVNTAIFSAATVFLEVLIGLVLALMVDRVKKGAGVFTSIFIVPLLVSPIAVGVIWLTILDPQFGPLNAFLSLFGVRGPFWVGQQDTIMLSAVVASTWEETPLVFLVLYAGLKDIPRQIYEAAAVDGLGGLSLLRRVVLPMIKPTLAVASILALMTSFRSFDLVYMFSINGPFLFVQTLPFLLYQLAFVSNFQQYGSAVSVIIMLIALVPTFIFLRVMRIEERLGLVSVKEKREMLPEIIRNGLSTLRIAIRRSLPHRRPGPTTARHEAREGPSVLTKVSGPLTYVFLAIMAFITLFPVYWLISTSLKNTDELFPAGGGVVLFPWKVDLDSWGAALRDMSGYMITSMAVTVAVILLTILIAVPGAYSISRFKTGGARIVSWSIIVNSMPSVIFVIPLFYYAQATHIYNTWFALISTYLIFTVPIALWLLIGFIEAVPKQIDDAAKIDGLGTGSILWRMIFPLIKPGLVAVVLLVIINCWHEFLFTLVLGLTVFSGQVPIGARGVTVYVSNFISATGINWATVSAGAILISLPLIILVIFLQKYFIGGLTLGSVKA